MRGTLFVVATPIGNLNDISARALRVLREVSLIAAEDTRRTRHLLARYGIQTPASSLHEHNEHAKTPLLLARLDAGDSIALVSDAGTPTLSDPGRRFVRAAQARDCAVVPIPGPSAILAALSVSGFEADTFTFMGFPPVRSKDRAEWFDAVRGAGRTVVFFEAPHRILATLQEFQAVIGNCDVVVAREMTKVHEAFVKGPISEILERVSAAKGEFTIVADIGHVAKYVGDSAVRAEVIVDMFHQMTENKKMSRRRAISELARRYGRNSREVYSIIENHK
jgi:16S rRNA (cytidine1402-2'-O)-methyltransferase